MYVIVFEAWNGKRCEVVFGEEKAKERYWELDEIYSEVFNYFTFIFIVVIIYNFF